MPILPNLIYNIFGGQVFYTSITTGGNIAPVNPLTGGAITNTLAFSSQAVARDPLAPNGTLYYVGSSVSRLGSWDSVTGVSTNLAVITDSSNPTLNLAGSVRMAFRDNGQLYLMDNSRLYTISTGSGLGVGNSTAAGTTSQIGTPFSSIGGSGDMAFDPANPNDLYVATSVNPTKLLSQARLQGRRR
jgi:hypothetical protein